MTPYKESMYRLLDDNSTKKYFIEYKGYFSSHISHGLHALYRLQAPVDIAKHFIEWHGKNLESSKKHLEGETENEPKPEDIDELLGAGKSFYYIYDHYIGLLTSKYGGSVEKMLAEVFPKLAPGLLGSALHGLIHLGYGFSSGSDWFVCEGLAYLHYSYLPLVLPATAAQLDTIGLGARSIIEVVEVLRKDDELIKFMLSSFKTEKNMRDWSENMGPFARRSGLLITFKGQELMNYINLITFPDELNAINLTMDKVPELARWLTDSAITIYAIAKKPNDFFLLHGVTSSWALKNIFPLMKSLNDVLKITQTFLAALFATYLAQDYPALQTELIANNNGLSFDWETLVDLAIKHDGKNEEHVFKLVQVCQDMSREYTGSDMEPLYRLAAHHCVTNSF